MRVGHIATFAVVGWYLLIPPVASTTNNPAADPKAPLSHWRQFGGEYNSANECSGEITAARRNYQGAQQQDADYDVKLALPYAQCIASDDQRLKGR